jgi:hypothetical protein
MPDLISVDVRSFGMQKPPEQVEFCKDDARPVSARHPTRSIVIHQQQKDQQDDQQQIVIKQTTKPALQTVGHAFTSRALASVIRIRGCAGNGTGSKFPLLNLRNVYVHFATAGGRAQDAVNNGLVEYNLLPGYGGFFSLFRGQHKGAHFFRKDVQRSSLL